MGYNTSAPTPLFPWTPGVRGAPKDIAWPPTGLHLEVRFGPPQTADLTVANMDVVVTVHFEMYDGLPALRKWVSISHVGGDTSPPVTVNSLNYELLRAPNFAPERMSVVLQQANNPSECSRVASLYRLAAERPGPIRRRCCQSIHGCLCPHTRPLRPLEAPLDQQIKPDLGQSFPGREQQLWFADPLYDQCCDNELHVT